MARSFSASVVAGEPLTITVPTSGVDPDGDSVTVQGIVGEDAETVDLSLGRVTAFGASTISYEAYPRSAGTEVLHYQVRDRFGATSTGFVRIGVVQPGDPQPPVAVEDEVRAAPGKRVTVDVTENDLIARGDAVELEYQELNDRDELARWRIDARNTYFSTTVQEPGKGVQHLTYGITNGLFDPSRASVTVVPTPGYKNPPVAVDDVAKPKAGEEHHPRRRPGQRPRHRRGPLPAEGHEAALPRGQHRGQPGPGSRPGPSAHRALRDHRRGRRDGHGAGLRAHRQ